MNVTNLGLTWNSRYLELSTTEMGIAIVAALLVGGAALYILLKVLRSKPVKLLGMTLLVAGIPLVGWLALDQHQQDERTCVSEIWSRTFENRENSLQIPCPTHVMTHRLHSVRQAPLCSASSATQAWTRTRRAPLV